MKRIVILVLFVGMLFLSKDLYSQSRFIDEQEYKSITTDLVFEVKAKKNTVMKAIDSWVQQQKKFTVKSTTKNGEESFYLMQYFCEMYLKIDYLHGYHLSKFNTKYKHARYNEDTVIYSKNIQIKENTSKDNEFIVNFDLNYTDFDKKNNVKVVISCFHYLEIPKVSPDDSYYSPDKVYFTEICNETKDYILDYIKKNR